MDEEAWYQKPCSTRYQEDFIRIHIIGGPGSGKTTLAREIGAYLGVEVHELDGIAFTGPDYVERPLSDRVADIHLIAQRPAWITEGFFVLWIDELLTRADIIVWLDHVGWRIGIWRITRRYMKLAFQEVRNRQGLEKFARFRDYARHMKQFIQVFFSSRAYYVRYQSHSTCRTESRQSTAARLTAYKEKVIHCYNDEGVEAFLDYVHYCLH